MKGQVDAVDRLRDRPPGLLRTAPRGATTTGEAHLEPSDLDDGIAERRDRVARSSRRSRLVPPRGRRPRDVDARGASALARGPQVHVEGRANIDRLGASGWKGHPRRDVLRIRRVAARDRRACRGTACRRSPGTRPRAPSCTGAAGSWKTRSAAPSSTIRPAYMIAIRSATSTSTERSWVMNSIARPELPLQALEELAAPAPAPSRPAPSWARRRSRATGCTPAPSRSSPAASALRRARAGSRRCACAGRPTSSSSSAVRTRASRSPASLCTVIASATWSPIRRTGFSACSAPWKMIDAPVQRTARSCPGLSDEHVVRRRARMLSLDLRLRRVEPEDRARDRGLAAARLARESEHLHRARFRGRRPRTAGTSPPLVR